MPGFSGQILCYVTIGNLRAGTPTGSTVLTTDYNGMLSPAWGNIIAYNKIMNGQNSTVMASTNTYFRKQLRICVHPERPRARGTPLATLWLTFPALTTSRRTLRATT